MAKDNEAELNRVGIIPDFFYDIIAYIIPGNTALILFTCNLYLIRLSEISFIKDVDLKGFSLSLLVAYVIGRFFEQLGLMTIHRKRIPFFGVSSRIPSPKWSLIFNPKDDHYTESFKNNVAKKIEE